MDFLFHTQSGTSLFLLSSLSVLGIMYLINWRKEDISSFLVDGNMVGGSRKQVGGALTNISTFVVVGIILAASCLVMMNNNPALRYQFFNNKAALEGMTGQFFMNGAKKATAESQKAMDTLNGVPPDRPSSAGVHQIGPTPMKSIPTSSS
jgi:hypothetical protein